MWNKFELPTFFTCEGGVIMFCKYIWLLFAISIIVISSTIALDVTSINWRGETTECVKNELIIKFKPGYGDKLAIISSKYNLKIKNHLSPLIKVIKSDHNISDYTYLAQNVMTEPFIDYVELNYIYELCGDPTQLRIRIHEGRAGPKDNDLQQFENDHDKRRAEHNSLNASHASDENDAHPQKRVKPKG